MDATNAASQEHLAALLRCFIHDAAAAPPPVGWSEDDRAALANRLATELHLEAGVTAPRLQMLVTLLACIDHSGAPASGRAALQAVLPRPVTKLPRPRREASARGGVRASHSNVAVAVRTPYA